MRFSGPLSLAIPRLGKNFAIIRVHERWTMQLTMQIIHFGAHYPLFGIVAAFSMTPSFIDKINRLQITAPISLLDDSFCCKIRRKTRKRERKSDVNVKLVVANNQLLLRKQILILAHENDLK